MKIAIFGTNITADQQPKAEEIIHSFITADFNVSIYTDFKLNLHTSSYSILNLTEFSELSSHNADIILSLGGDGTFLKCAHLCYKTNIPILGINFGKLGFLAQTNPNDIDQIINDIQTKNYNIIKRSLLDFSYKTGNKKQQGIGVNEITLQKSNAVKLIKINVYIDKEFFCSFWADGVAVSTSTGSTGYSLSLGSPILTPDNESVIITPIAPHTLSIRPIIIPNSKPIQLEASGEFTDFLLSNDYQSNTIQKKPIITIKKSRYKISTIQFKNSTFFDTLREKLKLGIDVRK